MLNFLYIVPKNLVSYIFGLLAIIPLPMFLREPFYEWYAHRYGVAIEEASRPLESYACLQDFFTRDLAEGIRPLGLGVVSPVDGRIVEFGEIQQEVLIQAKDRSYTIGGLLKSEELSKRFRGGSYVTIYLAPGDYHHIHAPVSGRIVASTHIPGSLWPVNEESVEKIEELFTKNERITTILESKRGAFAVVKVGATNVGSIRTTYNDFRANPFSYLFGAKPSILHQSFSPGIEVKKAQRIGSFFLGSTVVLVSENPEHFKQLSAGKIKLGETLYSQGD